MVLLVLSEPFLLLQFLLLLPLALFFFLAPAFSLSLFGFDAFFLFLLLAQLLLPFPLLAEGLYTLFFLLLLAGGLFGLLFQKFFFKILMLLFLGEQLRQLIERHLG